MNGNGLHELHRVRRLLADLDRRIYANDEIIRMVRDGKDTGDRAQTVANYMAENEDLEATSDELRYLIALSERQQAENRSNVAWPAVWQAAVLLFAVFVTFLFALAVLRL